MVILNSLCPQPITRRELSVSQGRTYEDMIFSLCWHNEGQWERKRARTRFIIKYYCKNWLTHIWLWHWLVWLSSQNWTSSLLPLALSPHTWNNDIKGNHLSFVIDDIKFNSFGQLWQLSYETCPQIDLFWLRLLVSPNLSFSLTF